jgi:hypothetical protein
VENTKHVWRAVLIILILFIIFITVRQFLIPASFGLKGHYRYDSINEYEAYPVIHGDASSCNSCHKDIYLEKIKGRHATVSCEVCHGALTYHVKDGKKINLMPIQKSYTLCVKCHQKLDSRPTEFPQIIITKHLEDMGAIGPNSNKEIAEGICIGCHSAHEPAG